MPKRILDLNETLNINANEDILPIVRDGETQKITAYNLLRYANNYVYQGTDLKALTGNWESTKSTVQQNSSVVWNYQGADIKSLSGDWENTKSLFRYYSAGWVSLEINFNSSAPVWTYWTDLVESNYTKWDEVYDTVIQDGFDVKWNSVYSTVVLNSASNWLNKSTWDQVYNVVQSNSTINWNNKPTWDEVYSVVQLNSASNWNNSASNSQSVFNTVQTNSATNWDNLTERLYTQTFFLPKSGGAITNNLNVSGNIVTIGKILSAGIDIHTLFGTGGGGGGSGDVTLTYLHNGFLPLSGGTLTNALEFTNSNLTPAKLKIQTVGNNSARIYTAQAYPIILTTSSNQSLSASRSLFIDADGEVSIGNTSPSEKLHVSGNILSDNENAKITAKSSSNIQFSEIKAQVDNTKNINLRQHGSGAGGTTFNSANANSGGLYGEGLDRMFVSLDNSNPIVMGNTKSQIRIGDEYISINSPTSDLSAALGVKQLNVSNAMLDIQDAGGISKLYVGNNGNIGINTDTPDTNFELTVNGSITAHNVQTTSLTVPILYSPNGIIDTLNATYATISNISNGINIETDKNNTYPNLGLIAYYTGIPSSIRSPSIGISTTIDGEKLNKILEIDVPDFIKNIIHPLGDSPSIEYFQERFYLALGASAFNFAGLGNITSDVIILTSNDIVNNEIFIENLKLNGSSHEKVSNNVDIYSPKWFFEDDNNLYLTYCVHNTLTSTKQLKITRLQDIRNPTTQFSAATALTFLNSEEAESCYIHKYGTDASNPYYFAYKIIGGANAGKIRVAKRNSLLSGAFTSVLLINETVYSSPYFVSIYELETSGAKFERLYVQNNNYEQFFYKVDDNTNITITTAGLTKIDTGTRMIKPTGKTVNNNVKEIFDFLTTPTVLTKPLEDPFSKKSVKAWGVVTGAGALTDGYNCSVTGSLGNYTVTLTEPLLNTNAAVIVNVNRAGASGQNAVVTSNNTINIATYNDIAAITPPTSFSFVVYGN